MEDNKKSFLELAEERKQKMLEKSESIEAAQKTRQLTSFKTELKNVLRADIRDLANGDLIDAEAMETAKVLSPNGTTSPSDTSVRVRKPMRSVTKKNLNA